MGRRFTPLSDRIETYAEVRRLVESGSSTSPTEIALRLKDAGYVLPPRETIRRWAIGRASPLSCVRQFVPKPSPELSFFLGAWLGDGWADDSDGGSRLRLKVRSEPFATEFAHCASIILSKAKPYRVWRTYDSDGTWYNVKVTSVLLSRFLESGDCAVFSLIVKSPAGFLRGFFTAEGNPSVNVSQRGGRRLNVGLDVANSDKALMRLCRQLLLELGYHPGRLTINIRRGDVTNLGKVRKTVWLLRLSRLADVRRFAAEIGFADSVKNRKVDDAASLILNYGKMAAVTKWTDAYVKQPGKWVLE